MPDSALPPPADLEYKSTKDTVIGYTPAAAVQPGDTRTGTALTDDERQAADQVVGSPAQGNGLTNSNMASVGGLGTDSGGTQTRSTVGKTDKGETTSRRTAASE